MSPTCASSPPTTTTAPPERNQGVVLNYKYEAFPTQAAVLDISVNTSRFRWQPEGVHPTPWQFDTWSAQGLWFWRPTMKLRPTAALIAELADVVSKNGNYLLNITPDPDGLLGPEQEKLLSDIGQWLAVNGEAIHGTRPWKVYGEGPTSGLGPSFSPTTPKTPYTPQDIRFTTKGETLYAIVLAWPADRKVLIRRWPPARRLWKRDIQTCPPAGLEAAVSWKGTASGLAGRIAGPVVW